MIDLWNEDYCLALERQDQSKELSGLYRTIQSVKTSVDDVDSLLDVTSYDDQQELEQAIISLQVKPRTQQSKISKREIEIFLWLFRRLSAVPGNEKQLILLSVVPMFSWHLKVAEIIQ